MVIGGFGGHVSRGSTGGGSEAAISNIRTWGVATTSALKSGASSTTKGAQFTVPGISDFSGQYTAYGSIPSVLPGETFEFEGAITGSEGTAVGVKGDCIADSLTVNWDYEGGTPINHSVGFSANGALTRGTVTCPADDGDVLIEPSVGLVVSLAPTIWGAAAGSHAPLSDVRTASLTLSRSNGSYASSTSVVTKRTKGVLEGTLSLSLYAQAATGWGGLAALNTGCEFKLYVNATEYWLLKWMVLSDIGGMDVDVETGAPVGCTMNFRFTAYWNVSGTLTEGSILLPSAADVWPEA